eukprot:CAMPEP_0202883400 /NCGR_PEP_ID=MMETSP1391-20130828/39377_1 /ASSEMBLY_ACC=CAM_ASM_000867 /TAXON_ID=1034604 /ORGANISM="Chlamydomonas leiostraca, Strain SAG 11-49" /LENGTH=49 /DNA_ID= /DNA_START= /DNA_END= /DNA_ORIENTATION=
MECCAQLAMAVLRVAMLSVRAKLPLMKLWPIAWLVDRDPPAAAPYPAPR